MIEVSQMDFPQGLLQSCLHHTLGVTHPVLDKADILLELSDTPLDFLDILLEFLEFLDIPLQFLK